MHGARPYADERPATDPLAVLDRFEEKRLLGAG